jgi:hypothetical protein
MAAKAEDSFSKKKGETIPYIIIFQRPMVFSIGICNIYRRQQPLIHLFGTIIFPPGIFILD